MSDESEEEDSETLIPDRPSLDGQVDTFSEQPNSVAEEDSTDDE